MLDYNQAFSAAKILDQSRKTLLDSMTAKGEEAQKLLADVMDQARQTNDLSSVLAASSISTDAWR